MHSLYTVPIIPLNLRKEETIVQIAEVIQYLSAVTDDILKRVNNRIELNGKQLDNISERINKASKKISKLTGAKKATQVFSSSKYPAAHVNRQYQSVFNKNEVSVVINRCKVKCRSAPAADEPLDNLQFYHVKVRRQINKQSINGLGGIPKDIVSVNDMLLYNTGKNPYKNYEMSDTLHVSRRFKRDDSKLISNIGAAPLSISDRSTINKVGAETYSYAPNLGDVPAIDVPLDLPDLPGIADDLRFVTDSDVGIAPSVTTTPNIPDLPSIAELPTIKHAHDDKPPPEINLPAPPSPTIMDVTDTKPPEWVMEEQVPVVEYSNTNRSMKKEVEEPSKAITFTSDSNNAHANLMEAIRKAGGSKNAKLRTAENDKQEEKTQLKTGGDLMADLHAKLAMRRKGISGAKTDLGKTDAGTAMDRISAMIPPPPQDDKTSSGNTEDEDWDE